MAKSKPAIALTDQERFPLLSDLTYLAQLRQDEFAPRFNFQSGDRLQLQHLEKVKAYADTIRNTQHFGSENEKPAWLDSFLTDCVRHVPFYTGRSTSWNDQPTLRRGDLASMPWQFVSLHCTLDDMLVYQTSGTSGEAMDILFDPVSQACWLPQLESVLDRYGIQFSRDSRKVAIALVSAQQSMLMYASLSTYLNGSGLLKLNLNPSEWNDAAHRIACLEKYNPEVLTGDPFSFLELLKLKPRITPKAMVSSAMKLTTAIQMKLQEYFKCPVLDIYSLTECKMIAVAESDELHRAMRPDLHLEVFDPHHDKPVAPGERGELVVSGGNNPFLPLIRYRTGDYCSILYKNGIPFLKDLEARAPVVFYDAQKHLVTTVDISRAINQYELIDFELHQNMDNTVSFNYWSPDEDLQKELRIALERLFGKLPIQINRRTSNAQRKTVRYTSERSL